MARIYGKNSGYLIKNEARYYFLAVGLVLLPLLVIWLLLKFSSPAVVGIGAVILIFFLVIVSEPLVKYLKAKSGKFYSGWGGELEVRRVLKSLPDDFAVFQDLNFPGRRGNIDFAVVGPTGVFTLEVKSHKGSIGFNGRELLLNGRAFWEKNVLEQSFGHAIGLKNYLRQAAGQEVFVKPALVFSRGRVSNFGFAPIRNVFVVGKDFLPDLLETQAAYHYPLPQNQVEQALSRLVKGSPKISC
jgi:hypothetical protein